MSDMPTVVEPTTHTLDVPGASLAWDVRPGTTDDHPVLVMVGYPMGATGFTSLAARLTDRTVVTYDPRGIERSTTTGDDGDESARSLTEQNVADLHAVLGEVRTVVGGEAVDVLASSGGAITALALVATHPDDVHTLVAHEPPTEEVLEDRAAASAAFRAVHDTYMAHGGGAGMAHFVAMVSHQGPFPDDWADQPAPDPAMFGMPTTDDGSRDDPLLSQAEGSMPSHELDYAAIDAASTRVVIGVGEDTGQTYTGRTSAGVAERLGGEPVAFPGDHGGFMGGEYGQPAGKPDEFAATLRAVLDA